MFGRETISQRNASGVRGVSFEANRWRARIYAGRERRHIGYYDTKEEAANAYARAVRELMMERATP
jgi:hypothetical protein